MVLRNTHLSISHFFFRWGNQLKPASVPLSSCPPHKHRLYVHFFLYIFLHAQEEDRPWGMITFTEVGSLDLFPGMSKICRAMTIYATEYFWQKGNPSFKVSLILQIGAISWGGPHLTGACREVRVTALLRKEVPPKAREVWEAGVLLHLEGSY